MVDIDGDQKVKMKQNTNWCEKVSSDNTVGNASSGTMIVIADPLPEQSAILEKGP